MEVKLVSHQNLFLKPLSQQEHGSIEDTGAFNAVFLLISLQLDANHTLKKRKHQLLYLCWACLPTNKALDQCLVVKTHIPPSLRL